MGHHFIDIAASPSARSLQAKHGNRKAYERIEAQATEALRLGASEASFIAAQDHFVMATVSDAGWPFVQHRGGPRGFLKVIDDSTIGFADYRGNRQYPSAGNVSGGNDRVAILLVDFAHRQRLKLLGRARLIEAGDAPELFARLADPGYPAPVERAWRIRVEALDWNCPRHITPRLTAQEWREASGPG